MTLYTVLEKDTIANTIITAARFDSLEAAENWIEQMQMIFEEERGYKIVEEELA
jgi:hypothetical protein